MFNQNDFPFERFIPAVHDDGPQYVVAALYRFVELPNFTELQEPILAFCKAHHVVGTLLLAREGINGTICGPRAGIVEVMRYLWAMPEFSALQPKYALADAPTFKRMKVKLKREIVTMGVDGIDPNRLVGRYVPPAQWNALIESPDTLVIDTRNHYEVALGTFKGAVDPKTQTFRAFPDWVKHSMQNAAAVEGVSKPKKIAMFCTGGIRCEKATAYMLEQGFEEVYHLEGGILKYLEEIPPEDSLWQGECFVFDERVSVKHGLEPGEHDMCFACRMPVSQEDKLSPKYVLGESCPKCFDDLSDEQKQRFAERQRQSRQKKSRGGGQHPSSS